MREAAAPSPGGSATGTSSPGGDYNRIPYVSNPFPQSEPARLFGYARLFGLAPPAVETARVLELGSASGGNIIPLAARFPKMRIVGVDLTPRHIEDGNARIRAAGLENIRLRQGDIAAFDPGPEPFDAIICHGVYSWVPPAARAAILRLAGRHLVPDGVAYISYNIYPGWHLRSIIRDLMLYHAGAEGTLPPTERIAKARWVIENVSRITNAGSPYGAKLREEAAALATVGDHYILGEFLATYNDPCYFRDFHAAAAEAGLSFLCESELESCLPETHGEEVGRLIRTMSANQLVPMEQYIDFFIGRQFRQTLLVRRDREPAIKRTLMPERAAGLPVHGPLEAMPDPSAEGRWTFRTPKGRTVTTTSPVVARALQQFAAAAPETRTAEELGAELRRLGVTVTAADEAAILDTLFKMIVAGLVKPSALAVRLGRADAARPVASPLARADAAAGRSPTANLKHETTAIDAVNLVLLPYLDGNNDRAALTRQLVRAALEKRVAVTDDQTKMPLAGPALERACREHVELALSRLAGAALLLPAAGAGGAA